MPKDPAEYGGEWYMNRAPWDQPRKETEMPAKHVIVIYDDADNEMDRVLVTNSQSDEVVDQLPMDWRIEKVEVS